MMGKYLNGYSAHQPLRAARLERVGRGRQRVLRVRLQPERERPPASPTGTGPRDYLTDVLADKGTAFIRRATDAGDPFVLEIATFAPHASLHAGAARRQRLPGRQGAPNAGLQRQEHQPAVLARRTARRWRASQIASLDDEVPQARPVRGGGRRHDRPDQDHAQQARRGRRHLPRVLLRQRLPHGRPPPDAGQDDRLRPRHRRAADRRRARGPGRPDRRQAGRERRPPPDLHRARRGRRARRTWTAAASSRCWTGPARGDWRAATLVEHHGPDQDQSDPDFQARASGNPASYEAIRTPNAVYVEYKNGDREYYDLVGDPYELDNTYAELSPDAAGAPARRARPSSRAAADPAAG